MNADPPNIRARFDDLQCVVVIPTYNNCRTIEAVINDVKAYSHHILVVNDGSTDNTAEILAAIDNIEVIGYEVNRGKGSALKKAFAHALGRGFKYAVTIDSDGQHFAGDLANFAAAIDLNPNSLLIGARNLNTENMPSENTFANKFSNFWYWAETGRKLADTQSGFRLYPLKTVAAIKTLSKRYEYEVEIIVKAAWQGCPVGNIPVRVYYPPENERISHFKPVNDFMRISLINTYLIIIALIYQHPRRWIKKLTKQNIKKFINDYIIHSPYSNRKISGSLALGVFCGIIPIWGYQMITAGVIAHFLKLSKGLTIIASNISILPMIPFILFVSYLTGGLALGNPLHNIDIHTISFDFIKESLLQYIVGSFIFASAAGALVWVVSNLLLRIFRRNR
ncbi:MAG: DUF2062 domain-containing protein [Prolixibacteraceae bacterium]|nr:DUF2062 domain-containing protein [Prolixibacteraceae bacterium]